MSIARLTPKAGMRRFLYFLSACFGLVLAALLFQRIIVCSRSPAWQHNQTTYCYLGRPIAIVTLCSKTVGITLVLLLTNWNVPADIPADTFLIVIPLHMLWRMNLSRPHRFLLLVVFSASVLNSILGIVYSIFVLRAQSHHIAWTMLTGLMANIKACAFFVKDPNFACQGLLLIGHGHLIRLQSAGRGHPYILLFFERWGRSCWAIWHAKQTNLRLLNSDGNLWPGCCGWYIIYTS